MKRFIPFALIIICLVSVIACGSGVYALAESKTYAAYFSDTPVYASADTGSEVISKLACGQQVTVTDTKVIDSVTFYEINSDSVAGYVLAEAVYEYRVPCEYQVAYVRAKRTAKEEKIKVYASPSTDSEVLYLCADGVVLDMVTQYSDEFYIIHLADDDNGDALQFGYIAAENITTGLSYYQTIAVITVCVVIVAVGSIVLIQSVGKKKAHHTTASFE